METTVDTRSTITLIEQILDYRTLFSDIVTTTDYALSLAMNKSLHATLVKLRGPITVGVQMMFFMFLCEHSWDPLGANFAIFQHCHHRFQCIEADILLRTPFLSCNTPFRADELIKMLFISWRDSCAWPSEIWLVVHITVATAEMCQPLPHCANIHCLVPINVQQSSMNVIGCNFFRIEELITQLCFMTCGRKVMRLIFF
jgi:hypothetical protein